MNKLRILIALLLFSICGIQADMEREIPDWNVNIQNFQYNASMVSRIFINNELEEGQQNLLGAFYGDECRGIAEPIIIGNAAYYFLTVHANDSGEEIDFRFYLQDSDVVVDISESIIFYPNEIYGSISEPLSLHGYHNYDLPPEIIYIPDQLVDFGETFPAIDLNDHLLESDGESAVWSCTGAEDILITISEESIAEITVIDPLWSGTSSIIFTVTDITANALSDTQTVNFTIRNEDHPPQITAIGNQIIASGQQFTGIALEDFLIEIDNDEVIWSYQFAANNQPDPFPQWSVNANDFEFNMSIVAQVTAEGSIAEGDTHLLAAFCGDECRGIVYAIPVAETWLYFLTVYANSNSDEISFRYYENVNQELLPILETINFSPNAILGNIAQPYVLNAGHIFVDINLNYAEISIGNAYWSGSETVIFTVTDLATTAGYSDSEEVSFTVSADNAPQILPISDQSIITGEEFDLIYLDEHLVELDGDDVFWSALESENLMVSINAANIAEISLVWEDWTGSEIITFIATDNTAFAASSSWDVSFSVTGIDHPPVVEGIPDQVIASSMQFEPIALDDYLFEEDNDTILWDYSFLPEEFPQSPPQWAVNPNQFPYTMTIVAEIISENDPAQDTDNILAVFCGESCRGIAQPIMVADNLLYFLTVYGRENNDELYFRFYDHYKGRLLNIAETYNFSNNAIHGSPSFPVIMNAANLIVNISDDNIAQVSLNDLLWQDTCNICFKASDQGTLNELYDIDEAAFTITTDNAPLINEIPDQIIFSGEEFSPLDLTDYLVELDGDEVSWSFSPVENLTITIDTNGLAEIMPVSMQWMGSESVTFRVEDNTDFAAYDTQEVVFSVLQQDYPPLVSDIPDQQIYLQQQFQEIDLNQYVTQSDDDSLIWNYEFMVTDITDPLPDWEFNPYAFQYSMSLVATIESYGKPALSDEHILAAFCGDECRGITSAVFTADRWMYYLNIMANNDDDLITLKFYDQQFQKILPCSESYNFTINQIIGSPVNPVNIFAGWFDISINDQNIANINIFDEYWAGYEIVNFTATETGTSLQYSDSDDVMLSVISLTELHLPETLSFNEDELFTVDFSPYVLYGDPAEYTLSVSNNDMISVDINGFMVEFQTQENWFGSEMLTFHISNEQGYYISMDSVNVVTLPVNDPPEIVLPDSFGFNEDESLTEDFETFLSDIEDDPMVLMVSEGVNILTEINGFMVTFTATDNWNGEEVITFTINDNSARAAASDTVTVTVTPVNDAPIVNSYYPLESQIALYDSTEITFSVDYIDIDGDALSRWFINDQLAAQPDSTQFHINFDQNGEFAIRNEVYDVEYTIPHTWDVQVILAPQEITITREFTPGWNLWSYNVELTNHELPTLFADMITENNLLKVKSINKSFDPNLYPMFNTFDTVTDGYGYWVQVVERDTLILTGDVLPLTTDIELTDGWNMVAYLPTVTDSVTHAFDSINDGRLVKVKSIRECYDPTLHQKYNTLDFLVPGNGYWVKVNADVTFNYPAPLRNIELNETKEYIWTPVIYINSTCVYAYTDATEGYVGAFVDGECRGIADVIDGTLSFVINGEYPENVTFKLYHKGQVVVGDISIVTNPGEDVKGFEIDFRDQTPVVTGLTGIYPNPFNPELHISYSLPKQANVEIVMYNIKGQKVLTLVNETQQNGRYNITWNGNNDKNNPAASGIYFIHIKAGDFKEMKKVLLMK